MITTPESCLYYTTTVRPSHDGYRNTIELPDGNNVVPLRSDTIRLVQNGCSFYGLRSEDPNQHLKDFLKLVDLLDLDVANRERTRMRSISTWEDLTTCFLAQFFSLGRTVKLQNDILMFQQHQDEGWNDPIFQEGGSLIYKNPNIEQLLWVMESHVDMLMKDAISIMGRSENVFGISSNMMRQLPLEPLRHEAFKDLVMNFILDQEEKVRKLEEYMWVIESDFIQLSLRVIEKLKKEIRIKENRDKKIEKIARYPDTEDLEPLNN
ncbi:hypothetical protein Tco_0173922 [Tanacetum coccineum]